MVNGIDSLENNSLWNESLAKDLQRFLANRLKCAEAAADLTHETYLRLYQRGTDNPPDNARALAFHIAMNLAVDYQRKLAVRDRHTADEAFDVISETTPSNSANPERILQSQQRIAQLQLALAELPLDCRTVFLLHGMEGLKYAEIAERMGISVSMVGRHLTRALAHCSQRLGEQ